MNGDKTNLVIQLKVSLEDIDPPIWRRLLMPGNASLDDLHWTIQQVMGWLNYHLHEFHIGERRVGRPDHGNDFWLDDPRPPLEDARSITLVSLLNEEVAEFGYTYDFGDDWNLSIQIEKAINVDEPLAAPECLEGERAGPPEDCGGPWGFMEMLESIRNPSDPEHDEWLTWLPGVYDPEAFSIAGANWILGQRMPPEPDIHEMLGWMGAVPERLSMAAHYYRKLWWALMTRGGTSSDEAAAVAGEIIDHFGNHRNANMVRLTPYQLTALITGEWTEDGEGIRLHESLGLEELADSRMLNNMREFLLLLQERGPVRMTATGNLPRSFVQELAGRMVWPSGRGELLFKYKKVWNEDSVWGIYELREILRCTGLLRRYKGTFRITRRGESLLRPEHAGLLLGHLFRRLFRDSRSAVLEELSARTAFELGIPYMIYRWAQFGRSWQDPTDVAGELVLGYVRDELRMQTRIEDAAEIVEAWLLEPLEELGMVERKREAGLEGGPGAVYYRATPLFYRFVSFAF